MKAKLLLLILLLLVSQVFGQTRAGGSGGGSVIVFSGVPTGSCSSNQTAVNTLNGNYYSCNGGAWLLVGPGAAGSAQWNTLVAPTGNQSISMTTFTSSWTYGNINAGTSFLQTFGALTTSPTVNQMSIIDTTANTNLGALLNINTVGTSTALPLQVTAQGTANGIKMSTAGLLQAIGTGGIQATTLNGNTFASPGTIGGTTPGAGTFTSVTSSTAGPSATGFIRMANNLDKVSWRNAAGSADLAIFFDNTNVFQIPGTANIGTQLNVAGAQISSTNLSDSANLVKTTANATFGAFTYNFTGSTKALLRVGAAAVTTQDGDVAYDSTAKNWHIWGNGVDNLNIILPATVTPANNDCAKFSVVTGVITITTAGAACGSGGGASLSGLTAATGANSILNGNFPQTWQSAQTTNSQAFLTLNESAAATGGTLTGSIANQKILKLATASASTATPLSVEQGSITGTVGFPVAQFTSTWNNASLVGVGIVENITNTLSATGSLLIDLQVGGVSQFKVDKAGAATATSITTNGTGGGTWTCTEGTAPTAAAGKDTIYCDQTSHALLANYNNDNGGAFEVIPRVNSSVVVGNLASWASATEINNAGIVAANVTTNSVTGTANQVPKFSGAHTITNSALSDNGTLLATSEPVNMTSQAVLQDAANASVTGTTVNLLAKLTSTGAVKIAVTDSAVPVYIVVSGAGTTSNAQLAIGGQAPCTMDATASNTEGFFVIASTGTAAQCHAQSSFPASGCIVGTLVSNSTTSGSNASVNVQPYCTNAAGGGSGTVNAGTTPQLTYYASSTNAVSAAGANLTWVSPKLQIGVDATTTGQLGLSNGGATGTTVTVQNNASTSAYNFNLPAIAGSSGNLLTSGGGGSTAMTWTTTTGSGSAVLATSATNVTLDAEGTGNVLTRPFYTSFTPSCNNATSSPGAFNVPTSAAATFTCFGTTTTQAAADFVDASTTTAVAGPFTLPQGWTGAIDVRLIWFANASSANAVRWSVQSACIADAATISTGPGSYNTASAANTAYTGTANQRKTTTLTGLTTTGCASGNSIYFQVQRIGGDAGDTLTATAELLEFQVEGRATK